MITTTPKIMVANSHDASNVAPIIILRTVRNNQLNSLNALYAKDLALGHIKVGRCIRNLYQIEANRKLQSPFNATQKFSPNQQRFKISMHQGTQKNQKRHTSRLLPKLLLLTNWFNFSPIFSMK